MVGHAGRAIRCRCPTRPPWQQWSLILIAAAIRHLLYTSSSSRFSGIGFRNDGLPFSLPLPKLRLLVLI